MYRNFKTGEEVEEDEAYAYAMKEVRKSPELKREYKAAVAFWFFSGGAWMKEDNNEDL